MPISPQLSQTPAKGASARILLVEEYKALAIAFGAALKKFAPDSEIRVVGSLQEADQLLPELKPSLLVIDGDPPPPHSLNFFNRLRTLLPDSRVLIVAAESAEEFTDRGESPPALEFIKKPFELEKFGALIQRLLARDSNIGTIRQLKLLDLILLNGVTEAQLVLRVEGTDGRSGEIHFADGRITHAAVMGKAGIEALRTMLGWRSTRFSEGQRPRDPPRTIHGEWAEVLREVLPLAMPEAEVALEIKPAKRKASRASPTRKIVVVDDTELLVQFVQDALAIAHPDWEIATALSGSDGLNAIVADEPDLVLLDYDLPDLTGADICEKLLENEETARVPIVMMSGHVAQMMETAARFENVVATIAKPFLAAALVELVEKTLRDSPQSRVPFAKKAAPKVARLKLSRNGGEHAATETSTIIEIALPSDEPVAPLADVAGELHRPPPRWHASMDATVGIPAGFKNARANTVVLGLPIEAVSLDFSAQLRVKEIRARQVSPSVWLHVLPDAFAQSFKHDKPFQLTYVQSDADGQIDFIHVAPVARPQDFVAPRYRLTVDTVEMLLADDSDTIRLAPTAVTPMRFELLALFELAGVELSPRFEVQHLLLKMRDKRVRATLLPETINVGATFMITRFSVSDSGAISEVRLVAA